MRYRSAECLDIWAPMTGTTWVRSQPRTRPDSGSSALDVTFGGLMGGQCHIEWTHGAALGADTKKDAHEVDVLLEVEPRRFELLTSALQRQRSTN